MPARGSGENLKLSFSENASNVYFSFLHFQSFLGGQSSAMKRGTVPESFEKSGSYVVVCTFKW